MYRPGAMNDDLDEVEEPSRDEFTLLEFLNSLMRSKGSREWLGNQTSLWFKERRHRIALERHQDLRRFRLARQQMWVGSLLGGAILGCLTVLVAAGGLSKDAALPLFGAIVGAVFVRARSAT